MKPVFVVCKLSKLLECVLNNPEVPIFYPTNIILVFDFYNNKKKSKLLKFEWLNNKR